MPVDQTVFIERVRSFVLRFHGDLVPVDGPEVQSAVPDARAAGIGADGIATQKSIEAAASPLSARRDAATRLAHGASSAIASATAQERWLEKVAGRLDAQFTRMSSSNPAPRPERPPTPGDATADL